MKKRVITGMMTASVIVSLAGCGAGQKENVESTAPATMTETVAASQVETAEVTETEKTVQADRAARIKAYQFTMLIMTTEKSLFSAIRQQAWRQ